MAWTRTGELSKRGPHTYERCVCSCGNTGDVRVQPNGTLRSRHCRGCGRRKNGTRPLGVDSRTFNAWVRLKNRHELCLRWSDVAAFVADVGAKPPESRLDRIDPLGPWDVGNCRWVKHREFSGDPGLIDTPEYKIWCGMWTRARNPNRDRSPRYVGLGIRVCEKWRSFGTFLADMGPRPSALHSIDRIDRTGHYEPSNCRWATAKEQANNTARSRIIEHAGRRLTVPQWSEEVGISQTKIRDRLRLGWGAARALGFAE